MKTLKSKQKIPYPELRGTLGSIKFPCFVDLKLDGECVLICLEKESNGFIVRKSGEALSDFKALNNLNKEIGDKFKPCMMYGELYTGNGQAGQLYNLLSDRVHDPDSLKIAIWDLVILCDKEVAVQPLIDRREQLASITRNQVRSAIAHDPDELKKLFHLWTAEGFEGVVAKNFDEKFVTGPCAWYKIKFKDQNLYVVDNIDQILERMEIQVASTKNGVSSIKKVGVKLTNKYKKNVKVGDTVNIEHQGLLDTGGLRHPVYKP